MKIVVAGTGYVGLISAVAFAHVGHTVVGLDVIAEKIDMLNAGKSPLYEPGLDEMMAESRERLSFTMDYNEACVDADVILIAVPTPESADGSANLDYVYEAARQACDAITNSCVMVLKSTVPIGTNDKVQEYVDEHCKEGLKIKMVSNPEFLSQGTALKDMLHATRIVVGTDDEGARDVMAKLYENFDAPILFTGRRSAEMVKYASNDFLALKISYINEIANLCEQLGADVTEVAHGMGLDPRIGDKFLQAGIGYGGSCFPKDTKALYWLSSYHNEEMRTVKAAIDVNAEQKQRLLEKAHRSMGNLKDKTVAILGLTFKPHTDDLRESPSFINVEKLLGEGAIVRVWDPLAEETFKRFFSEDQITYCDDVESAVTGADATFIITDWPQVKELDPQVYVDNMKTAAVFDGRNCYEIDTMKNYDIYYESIGRAVVDNLCNTK